MKPQTRFRTTVCLALAGLVLVLLAPPGSTAQQRAASLTVSPGVYVGGQRLTFEGNIGRTGVRRIHLQAHLGRAGDRWEDIQGFSTRTQRDGSFRFGYPAPGMFNISYRVVSGRSATPGWRFNARSQDLVLDVRSLAPDLGEDVVVAGMPFQIDVDTTPTLVGRPDLPPPPIPGRELTLQQRVDGDQWLTLDTATTDQDGNGTFDVTAADPGTVVYRVREEDWTAGGNQIGWYPSFPTYVQVLPGLPAPTDPATGGATRATAVAAPRSPIVRSTDRAAGTNGDVASTTASQKYGWTPSLWDFAWVAGESLTSPPYRGTDPKGRWLDASDGTGRAAKHNGGLVLDSQRERWGEGDLGTTTATLRGNPMKYGRWEVRLRMKAFENDARDYSALVELVPDRAQDYHCGGQNITVAEVSAHGSSVKVGAKALKGARQWTRSKRIGRVQDTSYSFAVEVSRRHISWFVDGQVIATVRSRAAVSDVPLTLRLRLQGDGQQEMNRTQMISDWERGFGLGRGRQVTSGHALKRGTHDGGC